MSLDQFKAAKTIGKRLRHFREEGGFNLAILASKLNFSVLDLVAIEAGNLLHFEKDILKFKDAALLYASEIDVDLGGLSLEEFQRISQITAKEWKVSIPNFLRKRYY